MIDRQAHRQAGKASGQTKGWTGRQMDGWTDGWTGRQADRDRQDLVNSSVHRMYRVWQEARDCR